MDELRAELMDKAIRYFFHYMKFEQESDRGTLYGMEYIRFALEEKNVFRFLFMRQNAYSEMREALLPVMREAILRLAERWHISEDEAHFFHDQLWMHTHGIASMAATEFCQWDLNKIKRMLKECEYYLSRKYEA